MPQYIVRSNVRKYMLDRADATRSKKFERVSVNVYEHLDAVVRREMDRIVHSHPSVGKTLKV